MDLDMLLNNEEYLEALNDFREKVRQISAHTNTNTNDSYDTFNY